MSDQPDVVASNKKGSVDEATKDAIAHAIDAGIIENEEQAFVEVLEAGVKGVFGIGAKPAVVRVTRKQRKRRRRRRRGGQQDGGEQQSPRSQQQKPRGGSSQSRSGGGNRGGGRSQQRPQSAPKKEKAAMEDEEQQEPRDDVAEQQQVVEGFLAGLVEALGLEGEVRSTVDDGIIKAEVIGDQTEVLVGAKGSLIRSVQELSRTVLQRSFSRPARVLVDIAGYGARRREALGIYAGRLAESVIEDGGEVMLEPMNAADRKVVHDAIAAIDGVRSYSEGEEPRRSVVIASDAPPTDESE
ncbi:MAG: Jag N-terminal domain-containing protein [Acidimicrobiia bacterium]|jgi:spoIIIJ-associated protein|nr:MAG: Jag N-terminal domain-containing protein [Acidimicrobiia bacterium]